MGKYKTQCFNAIDTRKLSSRSSNGSWNCQFVIIFIADRPVTIPSYLLIRYCCEGRKLPQDHLSSMYCQIKLLLIYAQEINIDWTPPYMEYFTLQNLSVLWVSLRQKWIKNTDYWNTWRSGEADIERIAYKSNIHIS